MRLRRRPEDDVASSRPIVGEGSPDDQIKQSVGVNVAKRLGVVQTRPRNTAPEPRGMARRRYASRDFGSTRVGGVVRINRVPRAGTSEVKEPYVIHDVVVRPAVRKPVRLNVVPRRASVIEAVLGVRRWHVVRIPREERIIHVAEVNADHSRTVGNIRTRHAHRRITPRRAHDDRMKVPSGNRLTELVVGFMRREPAPHHKAAVARISGVIDMFVKRSAAAGASAAGRRVLGADEPLRTHRVRVRNVWHRTELGQVKRVSTREPQIRTQ